METTVLSVTGMSCAGCVRSIEAALQALDGVEQARAELAAARVTVRHDASRASPAALAAAIAAAGFGTPAG